jgi:hypothetical protein
MRQARDPRIMSSQERLKGGVPVFSFLATWFSVCMAASMCMAASDPIIIIMD